MKLILFITGLLLTLCIFADAQVLKRPVPDKLVVLTFDDGVLSHYTNVAPLLKKYNFGGTFYVCEFPGKPNFSDKTKYMSWEQIAELHKMGFEIGNHTLHHAKVTRLDAARFSAELDSLEQKCSQYNIPKPVTFAYPSYDTSAYALKVLQQHGYRFARSGWDRPYQPTADNPLLMPGFTTHTENREALFKFLTEAKDGKIAVLTIHGVPDEAHPWVTTSPAVFEEILQFLKVNRYKVIAMRDLEKYIEVKVALK